MAVANLALRFVVEVLGVAALAYSGFQLSGNGLIRAVAAIGTPLLLIMIWASVVAPSTVNGLSPARKDIIGTVLLFVAAVALVLVGQPRLAIAFGMVVLANAALLFVLRDDASAAIESLAR